MKIFNYKIISEKEHTRLCNTIFTQEQKINRLEAELYQASKNDKRDNRRIL